MGHINIWKAAYRVALSRITGTGFNMYNHAIFAIYAPDPLDLHAAHSIYFQVLDEHVYIGFFLFMCVWCSVWRIGSWSIRNGGKEPETLWYKHMGAMWKVSLVGYAVGGALLSLAYFNLPYSILVIAVLIRQWLEEKTWANQRPVADPTPRLAGAENP